MKYTFCLILSMLFLTVYSQSVEVVKFNQLEERYAEPNDTLYVINYWATWCAPCVKELPGFMQLDQEMKGKPFKMILVSLDFPSQLDKRLVPFLTKRDIKTEVVLLDDDANVWIDKVNSNWDGAIPATQFIKNGEKQFYSEPLSVEELKKIVQKMNE